MLWPHRQVPQKEEFGDHVKPRVAQALHNSGRQQLKTLARGTVVARRPE